jgi:hypothetical protein
MVNFHFIVKKSEEAILKCVFSTTKKSFAEQKIATFENSTKNKTK